MKIQIGKIEGLTSKKGSKQNKTYNCIETNQNFYKSDCGKKTLWNVKGDWSILGIYSTNGSRRVSYTKDFKIID